SVLPSCAPRAPGRRRSYGSAKPDCMGIAATELHSRKGPERRSVRRNPPPPPRSSSRRLPSGSNPPAAGCPAAPMRSEEHTSELQSLTNLVCRLLLEKKKKPHTTLYALLVALWTRGVMKAVG